MAGDSNHRAPAEHDELLDAVCVLNQNVTVLWQAIDELRELVEWAVENRRVNSSSDDDMNAAVANRAEADPTDDDSKERRDAEPSGNGSKGTTHQPTVPTAQGPVPDRDDASHAPPEETQITGQFRPFDAVEFTIDDGKYFGEIVQVDESSGIANVCLYPQGEDFSVALSDVWPANAEDEETDSSHQFSRGDPVQFVVDNLVNFGEFLSRHEETRSAAVRRYPQREFHAVYLDELVAATLDRRDIETIELCGGLTEADRVAVHGPPMTLSEFQTWQQQLADGAIDAAGLRRACRRFMVSRNAIVEELVAGHTGEQLRAIAATYGRDDVGIASRREIAKHAFAAMLATFALGREVRWDNLREPYEYAFLSAVQRLTDEDIAHYRATIDTLIPSPLPS